MTATAEATLRRACSSVHVVAHRRAAARLKLIAEAESLISAGPHWLTWRPYRSIRATCVQFGLNARTRAVSATGWNYAPAGDVVVTFAGEVIYVPSAVPPFVGKVCSDAVIEAIARKSTAIPGCHTWIADASSLELLRPFCVNDALLLGFVPRMGTVVTIGQRRVEIVDGADFATHSFPTPAVRAVASNAVA